MKKRTLRPGYRRPLAQQTVSLNHSAAMLLIILTALFLSSQNAFALTTDQGADASLTKVHYRSAEIQGVNIAYREAGNPDNPTVLLLHGFPTSSQMFRNLIPELAADYHVLAPDYPGYGASDMPARADFDYSFANFADVVDEFVQVKEVSSYALYVMDYGAPVGYRLFAKHPERVTALVIQNGNAYDEGLRDFWDPIKAYWADPSVENRDALRGLLTIGATKWQYLDGVGDASAISPDTWHTDQYLLDRPGNNDIQLDMFLSYATNVGQYPHWQELFREHQPPAIILWGKNDQIFPAEGAHPYKQDLTDLEFHLLDTGHFALEEYGDVIAAEMLDFLNRKVARD
ncbi:MAG: pimeloyl-ACP methyl ester carboxylesterase [Paracoccaceae bacterium]|jgi:pimeloyl-ACP methyl ester carboxylesterase